MPLKQTVQKEVRIIAAMIRSDRATEAKTRLDALVRNAPPRKQLEIQNAVAEHLANN